MKFWSLFSSWFLAFQITVLITDGKSQDNVEEPAQKLRSQGVYIFAIGRCNCIYNSSLDGKTILPGYLLCLGVKSADTYELAQIASQPSTDFTAFVGEFKILDTLLPIVNHRVCSKAGGVYASDGMFKKGLSYVVCCLGLSLKPAFCFPEAFSGPSTLQFSGQTSDSLSFRWSEPRGPVISYLVQYVPLSGLGQPISAELRKVRARTCCGVGTNSS